MLTIIGCGNPTRGDDGAGVAVARRLIDRFAALPEPDVRVFDAGTAGMDVVFQARGSRALVIVDASASGSEPGAIFQVPGSELESRQAPSFGLHDFRWDHALYAGKRLFKDDFPADVTVYLIEKESLELGLGLSEAVESAVERVVELIVERVRARA